MTSPKPDRRVQRTRQLLKDALVALMAEKSYGRITVQDILDRAGVGRSTFYAHYQGKQDLLLRGVAGLPSPAEALPHPAARARPAAGRLSTAAMFRHARQNKALHQIMHQTGQEGALLEQGTRVLLANVRSQLEALAEAGQAPDVPMAALAHYVTGGLMALIRWWMEAGTPGSPEDMDAIFQQIGMPGVRSALSRHLH